MIRQIIHATVMGEEGMGKETVQEGGRREYKLVYKREGVDEGDKVVNTGRT